MLCMKLLNLLSLLNFQEGAIGEAMDGGYAKFCRLKAWLQSQCRVVELECVPVVPNCGVNIGQCEVNL